MPDVMNMNKAVVCYKIVPPTRRSEKSENPKKNKNASSIFFYFRRVRISANSEIFFSQIKHGGCRHERRLSLTVLTGPDIKTSIVKGQPNETIGDLLSRNDFLKGK